MVRVKGLGWWETRSGGGHGVTFKKFNSPFHTLGGHKIG